MPPTIQSNILSLQEGVAGGKQYRLIWQGAGQRAKKPFAGWGGLGEASGHFTTQEREKRKQPPYLNVITAALGGVLGTHPHWVLIQLKSIPCKTGTPPAPPPPFYINVISPLKATPFSTHCLLQEDYLGTRERD